MTPAIRNSIPKRRKTGQGNPGNGGYLTSCRFGPEEECGMADPTLCKVHGPLLTAEQPPSPEVERARAHASVVQLFFNPAHAERHNELQRLRRWN
ncbi:MAG TPA: hypothetical protein VJ770_19220 [Stellaceae bacterium]|nr:hypothetical protein [Stellaceae bacterium]